MAPSCGDTGLVRDRLQSLGLEGDRASLWESDAGLVSFGLDGGTLGFVGCETRHNWEGKGDADELATRGHDEHSADEDALRDIVCSPTNALLNW